jgi:putative cell wall-binding protein
MVEAGFGAQFPHMRRAALVVTAVLATLLVTGEAEADITSRLAGSDRYATAVEVSKSRFGPGVAVAWVASGRDFPDALAAGAAAAEDGGPVLLVDGGRVPESTATELQRLRPGRILVAGGASAVPDSAVSQLRSYGPVERVSGGDRYSTAAAISASTFDAAGTAYVASGERFPDALAGVPAAHTDRAPLLLVSRDAVPGATEAELRRVGARRVVLLGGTGVVSPGVESHLRSIAGTVERIAGFDRYATSALVSSRSFQGGVPVMVATGASPADALAGGPAAAGPVLLVRQNCIPADVATELRRLGTATLLGGLGALGLGVERRSPCPMYGATVGTPSVTTSTARSFEGPDPQLVRFGNTWYLYTTGTSWGNNIGVLTSSSPSGPWQTTTGRSYGSTALGSIPSWQVAGTQWAPGVFHFAGRYVMFYAAKVRATGQWCLSVGTSTSPTGPFQDRSTGPLICQSDQGGSIDPHPFIDADGYPWLLWKNNDGSSPAVSRVWSIQLGADGTSLLGRPQAILSKDTQRSPWMLTVDNPQMALVNGVHVLLFSGGNWENDTYVEGWATCSGAAGPCTAARDPFLTSYGDVGGPGAATIEVDQQGQWWMAWHGWHQGVRYVYTGPVRF